MPSFSSPRSLSQPPGWPAWLGSLVLHGLLMIAVALLLPAARWPSDKQPRERHVGIVLAQAVSAAEDRYFDQETGLAPADEQQAVPQSHDQLFRAALPSAAAADDHIRADNPLPQDAVGPAAPLPGLVQTGVTQGAAQPRSTTDRRGEAALIAADRAKYRPAAPAGPPARLELFGAQGVGHSFVFLIDRSQSMGSGSGGLNGLAVAEKALATNLARLSGHHRFQIIAYNDTLTFFGGQMRGLFTADDRRRQDALEFLGQLVAVKGTKHELAILSALRLKPDVIFLLSDAAYPPLTASQLRAITIRNGNRSTIHTIQFGSGRPADTESFLAKLARLNGGSFHYLDINRVGSD